MPAGRHPTHRTPLERKLELLEARFSQDPVGGSTASGGNSQHSFSFEGAALAPSSLLSNPTTLQGSRSASMGFDRVKRATERHLHKVQQKVVVWASDTSNNSGSMTVVANNQHHQSVVPNTPESQTEKKESEKKDEKEVRGE